MSKIEVEKFSLTEFIDRFKIDVVGLRNIIKEKQTSFDSEYIKKIEIEISQFKEKVFTPTPKYPELSAFIIKNEYQKYIKQNFEQLEEFDEKTEKLKKLEKSLKKDEENKVLKEEIEKLKISREIEKKKFSELIKSRNDFNKMLKNYLKKENIDFI